MYGEPINRTLPKIPKDEDLLVIVGAEKVPKELYNLADFNISVTNQPHSEIAALAIFLNQYTNGEYLDKKWHGENIIIPSKRGKIMIRRGTFIPNFSECIEILKNEGCSEEVIKHVKAVSSLALSIGKKGGADLEIIEAGALLHDLGRGKSHEIDHAVIGARIAEELGMDERVVNIIKKHIGGGLTKEDAEVLGLPPDDYIPQTLEEKIVCHSDSLVDDFRKVKAEEEIKTLKERNLKEAARKVLELHTNLSEIIGVDIDEI